MFPHGSSGPVIEQLEGRRLFSAGIESVHGFIAPDGSPYLYGKYVLALQSAADDPRQLTETHTVTIKRHDGPSFGGWVWGGKRQQLKGKWNASDDSYHFEVLATSSTGRITNRGTMVMWWDPSTQSFHGHWAYHREPEFPLCRFHVLQAADRLIGRSSLRNSSTREDLYRNVIR